MGEIKTEKWNGHEIRFVLHKEEWWAVARDVANALDYKLTTNMTRLLVDQDKGIAKVNTLGGNQELLIISEFGIYKAVFSSIKPEARQFERWVFSVIKELRKATGLEGFQVFRMLDKEHQKGAMKTLCKGLKTPVRNDFIKANIIANKAISNIYKFPKMIKKEAMTPEMLVQRQPILDDTVDLMKVKQSFDLNLSVSKTVYSKYQA